MAVREFAGGAFGSSPARVSWSIGTGGLASVWNGPITVAAIIRRLTRPSGVDMMAMLAWQSSGNPRSMVRTNDSDVLTAFVNGFQDAPTGVSWGTGDDWALIAVTKASGTAVVRGHKVILGGSATHTNSAGTIPNDTQTMTALHTAWDNENDWAMRGRYAVMAVWDQVLSDGDLEDLVSSYGDWVASAPIALWRFDQSSTSDPIDDETGNGADQSALTGSSVVTDDDPPGFSFEDPGGAVELDGTSDAAAEHAGTLAVTRPIAGASAAAAQHAADLAAARTITGQADVAGEHAAELTTARGLTGAADVAADGVGGIQVARGGDGSSDAAAEMTGSLTITRTLAAASDAAGQHGGTLTASRSLAGTADAAAQHTADLGIAGQVTLTGAMGAAAGHAGTVTVARELTATTDAAAQHVGALTVTEPGIVELAGVADAAASLTGQLSTIRPLAGASDAAAQHVGQLVPVSAGGTSSMAPATTPTATAVAPLVPTAGGVA